MTARLRATVVWCNAGQAPKEVEVDLPPGATARDAILAAGVLGAGAGAVESLDIGIFNRPCAAAAVLRDGDRVELYRPLAIDPKEARRIRAELRQKRKTAPPRP